MGFLFSLWISGAILSFLAGTILAVVEEDPGIVGISLGAGLMFPVLLFVGAIYLIAEIVHTPYYLLKWLVNMNKKKTLLKSIDEEMIKKIDEDLDKHLEESRKLAS